MMEDKNIVNLLVSSDIINMACKDIVDKKTNKEVFELLIEELSELIKVVEKLETELIKAVVKLERLNNGEITLRYNIDEIYNNLYEELGNVIIMILQFIYKNRINYNELIEKISAKLILYYETK